MCVQKYAVAKSYAFDVEIRARGDCLVKIGQHFEKSQKIEQKKAGQAICLIFSFSCDSTCTTTDAHSLQPLFVIKCT